MMKIPQDFIIVEIPKVYKIGSLGITVVFPHMVVVKQKGGSLRDQDKCAETNAEC